MAEELAALRRRWLKEPSKALGVASPIIATSLSTSWL